MWQRHMKLFLISLWYADIFEVATEDGTVLAMKLHRLGRTSFRAVKSRRDYLRHRRSFNWLYLSRLAALKEFAFMKVLFFLILFILSISELCERLCCCCCISELCALFIFLFVWLILDCLYLQALGDHGFPVPTAVDCNWHCVIMSLVQGYPL